jgi:hypothetical protein
MLFKLKCAACPESSTFLYQLNPANAGQAADAEIAANSS